MCTDWQERRAPARAGPDFENRRQAEAERERRAKVIHAEGELQASEKLQQAAFVLAQQSGAMQLRYMQTLSSIAGDKSSTIVVPLPIEMLGGLTGRGDKAG